MGTLTDASNDTLTVELRSGRIVSIASDVDTRVVIRGVEQASIAALEVGDMIGIRAAERDDGSLYALAIRAERIPERVPRRGAVLGRIAQISDNQITLNTRRGKVTVMTDY